MMHNNHKHDARFGPASLQFICALGYWVPRVYDVMSCPHVAGEEGTHSEAALAPGAHPTATRASSNRALLCQAKMANPPTLCLRKVAHKPTRCQAKLLSSPTPCHGNVPVPPTACHERVASLKFSKDLPSWVLLESTVKDG